VCIFWLADASCAAGRAWESLPLSNQLARGRAQGNANYCNLANRMHQLSMGNKRVAGFQIFACTALSGSECSPEFCRKGQGLVLAMGFHPILHLEK
jgi:hypothetical protein